MAHASQHSTVLHFRVCKQRKTICDAADINLVVGVVEGATGARVQGDKQSEVGRHGRMQRRTRKNSLGSASGNEK